MSLVDRVGKFYERFEQAAQKASEQVVGSKGFAELLGQFASNSAALAKLNYDAWDPSVLVVTAKGDHIVPRQGTLPLLDLVSSDDLTHVDRAGGHIGLMAGSKARTEIWPDIAAWMEPRSAAARRDT